MSVATPARIIFGALLAVIGLILAVGGAWLASLGGSLYYVIAGLLLLGSGIAFCLRRSIGFYLYAGAFVFTLLWALWEAGLNGWALVPRLAGPIVLMAIALLLVPTVPIADARRIRNLGLAALAVVVVGLGVGVSMASKHDVAMALPMQQASLAYDSAANAPQPGEWDAYGGGLSAQRYSDATQITLDNVTDLKRAWTFHAGGINDKWGTEMTPLKVGNRLYGCNALNVMFALDPATGQRIWSFDPHVGKNYIPYTAACRGVAFYRVPGGTPNQPCAERVIEGTLDMRLIAVDAATGRPCADFGQNGQANLQIGLGQKESLNAPAKPMIPSTASITATPVIVQGVVVTGQEVLDGQRRWAPSGVIRGYDAVTGQLRWAWDVNNPSVTKDPPAGGYYSFGTPNSWTAAVGDNQLGLAYIPTGNSGGDYYSSLRSAAENQVSSSIVALDVKTGKPRWVFQTVHKDVWDYDIGSQPSLIEFPVGGRRVPALLVPSKQGEIYILDRATGRSLQPVQERPVPQGGAEPGQRSPTQPFSTYHTLAQPNLTEKDMWGLSPIDQMICRIQFREAHYSGEYTPPELDHRTVQWPGYNGGSDWGSVAVDPRRGVIIANYNDTANYNMLISRQRADKMGLYPTGDPRVATGGGASAEGAGAQLGTPVAILVNAGWVMPTQVLCTQPPYGGIRAIDLASGKTLWDRPFGTARRNGPWGIPSLLPFDIGTPNNGGAVVTASGLVFIGAATDNLIRAIDIRTGKTVWSDVLPGGGQANPMIYQQNGKEYLVIMAGGHHFMKTPQSDALVAYALPSG
jgi:quinoprotein glucose dehydrogenase